MPSYLTLKLKSWSNKQEHQTVVIWVSKALSDKTRLCSWAGKSNWPWWDWEQSVCWHTSISSDHYNWSQTVNIVTWSLQDICSSLSHLTKHHNRQHTGDTSVQGVSLETVLITELNIRVCWLSDKSFITKFILQLQNLVNIKNISKLECIL